MKILVLNYEFPPIGGGGSPVSFEISKLYAQNGHQVDVITMGYNGLPQYEVVAGVNIYRVRCFRSKKEICYPWEQLSYIISAKFFLKRRLRTVGYDVCHTHFIIPTGILALWLKQKFNLKYIITSHGSDVLGHNKRFRLIYPLIRKTWKKVILSASYIVSASESLGQSIKSQLPKRKVNVIPNGIYPKKVISKKEKRILVVARLFINKGVQDILEALKEVNLNDWRVDIVGDGPCREELEVTAAGSSFARKIKFHGWLANGSKELDSLYSKSAIFISASYFESFSTVLLEALSYSCDVLATKVGGNPEIVEKENLFLPRDPSSLANRLKKAMSEYNGKPRKCLYLNRFDWTKIYEKYLDLLERAK